MAQLIFKNSSTPMENVPLTRLRTTIGRSARSDLCIPDAFASRLHAEVRQEGDSFWLQDLGSANGTRYNGMPVKNPVPISMGGEIQNRETITAFQHDRVARPMHSALIANATAALEPSRSRPCRRSAVR